MKLPHKFLSFLLIGCVLCLSCCFGGMVSGAGEIRIAYVSGTNVNIRKDASVSSNSLGTISSAVVTVNGSKKGTASGDTHTWYNITYNNISGYIRDDYLTLKTIKNDAAFEKKISEFPESYKNSLRFLHAVYPKWKFVAETLPLTLDNAVNLEIERKLVQNTAAVSFRSMGVGAYDWATNKFVPQDTNWYLASREVIRYYMDPRNFLNSSDIFAFMQLKYDAATQTESGLKALVSGSFLAKTFDTKDKTYGGSYIKVIMKAAKESGVNPYVLAATIIQEQGKKGSSPIISGTYPGYEGYYNFFNIQAYGSSNDAKYKRGLNYAKKQGWSSIPAAIIGGAKFCSNDYINSGQDTYFKMNFNIQNPERIWHEYAGAVHNALMSGRKIAATYTASTESDPTFYIPVYKSMPNAVSKLPDQNDLKNNYYFNSIKTSGLTPSFSRYQYSYDLNVSEDQTVTVSVPKGASYASNDSFSLNTGQNKITLKVKSESGFTTGYVLKIKAEKACTLYVDHGKGTTAKTSSSSSAKKTTESANSKTASDNSSNLSSDSSLESPVESDTEEPPVLIGDTSGDGKINGRDLADVKMHILNKKKLEGNAAIAADTNRDGKINGRDLADVKMHILNKKLLS